MLGFALGTFSFGTTVVTILNILVIVVIIIFITIITKHFNKVKQIEREYIKLKKEHCYKDIEQEKYSNNRYK